jgi:hypothetical protein
MTNMFKHMRVMADDVTLASDVVIGLQAQSLGGFFNDQSGRAERGCE